MLRKVALFLLGEGEMGGAQFVVKILWADFVEFCNKKGMGFVIYKLIYYIEII